MTRKNSNFILFSIFSTLVVVALAASNLIPLAQFVVLGAPYVPNAAFKLLIFLSLGLSFFYSVVLDKTRKKIFPSNYVALFLAFFGYLIANLWIQSYEFPISYVVFGFNTYYSFLFFLIFCVYLKLNDKAIGIAFVWISIPLMLLGVAQNVANSNVVADFTNSSIRSHAVGFYGRTRAVSLFDGSVNYGHFLCFILPLAMFYFLGGKKFTIKVTFASFVIFCLVAVFTTLTRATFLEAAMVMVFAYMLFRWRRTEKMVLLTYMPLAFGVLGVLSAYGGALIHFGKSNDLMSNESLLIRLAEWDLYLPIWMKNIKTFLFGYGVFQNENFSYSYGVIIDNVFLAVGYHIGIIGLILWFLLIWTVWRWMLSLFKNDSDNPVMFAVLSLWSAFMATGIFSLSMWMYPLFAMIAIPTCLVKLRMQGD